MAMTQSGSSGYSRNTVVPESRQVWPNAGKELYEDTDVSPVPAVYDHDHDTPVAMESEVFDKDGSVRVQQRHVQNVEQPTGFWHRFQLGLRSVWLTKHTEDITHNKDLYVKTTLRELIIYIVFLIDLCILTFGMISTNTYYFTQAMTSLFLDTTFGNNAVTFRSMSNIDDFWDYTKGPLLNGLYWEQWYNGDHISKEELGYIYFENKLLGIPRLRMLKVRSDSCAVADSFQREIKQCYGSYSRSSEDTNTFGPKNSTAWQYSSESQLKGQFYWGLVSTYGGGGFTQNLAHNRIDSLDMMKFLEQNLWIDRGTRVIFIDFTVYNGNINLFCIVKLVIEFPPVGGLIPSWSFRTVKLIRYVTVFDYVVLACEGIFCAFILYYIVEEIIELVRHRCEYFHSFWNILDIVVVLIALCCIAFSIYRAIVIDNVLEDLLTKSDSFADFEFLGFTHARFNDAVAIMLFFAWIKIFKYISFNKTMTQLSSTLSRCAKDVAGFAIMFFIFFFAYAQLGYLLFGTQIQDFASFYDSVFTLLRMILGDFNFHDLERANRILGPIFFITFVFFVFFILLNMFLAIINDTYAEVKNELAGQKAKFEIAEFFKEGYQNLLRKIKLKRDRIDDIQDALHSLDMNKDGVDYYEWRKQLQKRGYTDKEIEAMFARYDLDGDRVLDGNEQFQMTEDLVKRKANLDTVTASDEMPKQREGTGIAIEDFKLLSRRVDRIENSINIVINRIDVVLNKLEAAERTKLVQQKESNIMQ